MCLLGMIFHERPMPPSVGRSGGGVAPYIEACIEAFGPGAACSRATFRRTKAMQLSGDLQTPSNASPPNTSEAEEDALFSRTATDFYRLKLEDGDTEVRVSKIRARPTCLTARCAEQVSQDGSSTRPQLREPAISRKKLGFDNVDQKLPIHRRRYFPESSLRAKSPITGRARRVGGHVDTNERPIGEK